MGEKKCILSWKSVPQGPFGRIKLYFEQEKRPAGGFWADKSESKPNAAEPWHITGGGDPRGGGSQDHLNPKVGEQGGKPEALSQLVDLGGAGGLDFN